MPAGRPMKFKSVKELQDKIDAYFAHCDLVGDPYTITGLALALDTCRQTLLTYSEKPEYLDAIKKGKAKCEAYAEKRLYGTGQVAGAIFNLTNNYEGWSNRQAIDHGGQKDNPVVTTTSDVEILKRFLQKGEINQ